MRIKNFFLAITIFIFLINSSHAILEVTKLPNKDAEIEKIYKLEDGKYIYIEQWGRGDVIWEYDPEKDKFREISKVWAFIDLASKCEMVDGHNIYFANILEYWFGGGTIIDNPEIRIFDLYDESPWRDTDLGITPSMNYAEEFCTFFKPYYIKEK